MENLQVYAFTQCEGLTPVVCALKADLATPLLISASGNRQMWYLTHAGESAPINCGQCLKRRTMS